MRSTAVGLLGVCLLLVVLAVAQTGSHRMPTPPEALDRESQQKESPQSPSRHIDYAQVQREAEELARIAQTIPADTASARKGILPKDVLEKLKQIEKLSKKLRTELNP